MAGSTASRHRASTAEVRMYFQFDVSQFPPSGTGEQAAGPAAPEATDLLRQLLDVQRELLQLSRNAQAAQDATARWKAFLARWEDDFPGVAGNVREVLPQLERAYLGLITDLTDYLRDRDGDALDNDFALGEYLDRYGMRLGQLGTILSLVGPLAEAAGTGESS